MYNSATFGRFKSNCMIEGKWPRGLVAPPSWIEVIYVIHLYGVSRGLNLNLSSMGGRSLKLTDHYRTEARRFQTEPRPRQKLYEAEPRPRQ